MQSAIAGGKNRKALLGLRTHCLHMGSFSVDACRSRQQNGACDRCYLCDERGEGGPRRKVGTCHQRLKQHIQAFVFAYRGKPFSFLQDIPRSDNYLLSGPFCNLDKCHSFEADGGGDRWLSLLRPDIRGNSRRHSLVAFWRKSGTGSQICAAVVSVRSWYWNVRCNLRIQIDRGQRVLSKNDTTPVPFCGDCFVCCVGDFGKRGFRIERAQEGQALSKKHTTLVPFCGVRAPVAEPLLGQRMFHTNFGQGQPARDSRDTTLVPFCVAADPADKPFFGQRIFHTRFDLEQLALGRCHTFEFPLVPPFANFAPIISRFAVGAKYSL